jgi:hypothetical protein
VVKTRARTALTAAAAGRPVGVDGRSEAEPLTEPDGFATAPLGYRPTGHDGGIQLVVAFTPVSTADATVELTDFAVGVGFTAVPEPSTGALLAGGPLALLAVGARRDGCGRSVRPRSSGSA